MARMLVVLLLCSWWHLAQAMQALTEDMPPYNWRDDKGEMTGFSVQLLHALLKRSGLQLDERGVQLLPWARAYQTALYQPDIVLFTAARTAERDKLFQWVGPIGPRAIWFWRLASRSDVAPQNLAEATRWRIAAVRNSASAQQLSLDGFESLVNVTDETDKFRMLRRGRVELVTALELGAAFHMRQLGGSLSELTRLFVQDAQYDYYFAVSRGTAPAKVAALQQALDAMRLDGSLERLRQQWLK